MMGIFYLYCVWSPLKQIPMLECDEQNPPGELAPNIEEGPCVQVDLFPSGNKTKTCCSWLEKQKNIWFSVRVWLLWSVRCAVLGANSDYATSIRPIFPVSISLLFLRRALLTTCKVANKLFTTHGIHITSVSVWTWLDIVREQSQSRH